MEMNEVWTKSAMEQFGFTQKQADQWLARWSEEHYAGDTTLSYIDWLKHKVIDAQERLPLAANKLVQALEGFRTVTAGTTRAMQQLSHIISLVAPSLAADRKQSEKETGARH